MSNVYTKKIDWQEVAKIASVRYEKTVHAAYCRSVHSGNNNAPRLLNIINEILRENDSSDDKNDRKIGRRKIKKINGKNTGVLKRY